MTKIASRDKRKVFPETQIIEKVNLSELSVFLTVHIGDEVIDKASAEGTDPCSHAKRWIDGTLGQWARRAKIKLRMMTFFQLAENAKEAQRQINSNYRFHAHVLIGASTACGRSISAEKLIDLLAPFCANQSNLAEKRVAAVFGFQPRHHATGGWKIGHVKQDYSGVPWHLTKIKPDTIDKLIKYCSRQLSKDSKKLQAIFPNIAGRKPKLFSINRNLENYIKQLKNDADLNSHKSHVTRTDISIHEYEYDDSKTQSSPLSYQETGSEVFNHDGRDRHEHGQDFERRDKHDLHPDQTLAEAGQSHAEFRPGGRAQPAPAYDARAGHRLAGGLGLDLASDDDRSAGSPPHLKASSPKISGQQPQDRGGIGMSTREVYLRCQILSSSGLTFHGSHIGLHFLAGVSIHSIDTHDNLAFANAERVVGRFERLGEAEAAARLIFEVEARATGTSAKAKAFRDDLESAMKMGGLMNRQDVRSAASAALAAEKE